MINALQIFVFLPLFMITFPDISITMINHLITIATFDVLPSDDILVETIDAPIDEDLEDAKFVDIGFGSPFMTINLGTLYLTVAVFLAILILMILTRPCLHCSTRLKSKHDSIMLGFKGNMWIRYMMEGFLDIGICCALNYHDSHILENGIKVDSLFATVNNISFLLFSLALGLFPLWALIFYLCNFKKWSNEDFEEKYGAVFEGIRLSEGKNLKKSEKDDGKFEVEGEVMKRSALAYSIIFMTRRLALIIVVTIFREHLFIQINTLFLCSSVQVFYLTTYLPMEDTLVQRLEVFNEVTAIALINILPIFSDYNQNGNNSIIQADVLFLCVLFANLVVHLFFLFKGSIVDCKLKCKLFANKRAQ